MEFTGDYLIPAEQDKVWAGMNDPETLRRSIPGCEVMERTGENEFTATVVARVGPVSAKFKGKVQLEDLDPPNGYTLRGRGQGGPAGFAKGSARVTLEPAEGGTRLSYVADVDVGGKLASVGGRLIHGVAQKTADEFFETFSHVVTGRAEAPAEPAGEGDAVPSGPSAAPVATRGGGSGHIPLIDRVAWLGVGVAIGVAATLLAI